MIRGTLSVLRSRVAGSLCTRSGQQVVSILNSNPLVPYQCKKLPNTATFSSIVPPTIGFNLPFQGIIKYPKYPILENNLTSTQQVRTVTKYSLKKGKRKSVKAVCTRFYRLHWGAWIRTMAGRYKKLWKKSKFQKIRLKQHVFCNANQSKMLDKMVNKFWKRPRYYIDDPYASYNKREEFWITRRKPYRPEGVDYE